ncbi:Notch [Mactra antiquata]
MDTMLVSLALTTVLFVLCEGNVMVGVTITSYSNPSGTCSDGDKKGKCCDDPQRLDCDTGDTCDTYFDICVGSMQAHWNCQGAFLHSKTYNNTNRLTNITLSPVGSTYWTPGIAVFVFVQDDDSSGTLVQQSKERIDTLIEIIDFKPAPDQYSVTPHKFGWEGKTSLNITVSVWCADNYYGKNCDAECLGLEPVAQCDSMGNLICQPSDTILLEFADLINQTMLPDLVFGINRFFEEKVCGNNFSVDYPAIHTDSNTLSFDGTCNDRPVPPIIFESILHLDNNVLSTYFAPTIITGPSVTTQSVGEHIVSNVYVGIEIKEVNNPTGLSYNGNDTSSARQCCDEHKTDQCNTAHDKCDLQTYICIGEMLNNACIGAVSVSPMYSNTTHLTTCGSAIIDLTNNKATPSHAMIGGFRLTKNMATVQVTVKDIDTDSQDDDDLIDILIKNITVTPGPNITNAGVVDVTLNNTATVTLRILFWCAPGHSGPLCEANTGVDKCQPGWYGDACEHQLNACNPNPCKHKGVCNVTNGHDFRCACDPGYTGSSCEQDIDECSLGVCQNNGTCNNTFGSFHCTCPPLWSGIICTDSKDPACDPNPCAHGRCSIDYSTTEHYRCDCDRGWKGVNCNEQKQCSSAICINGDCRLENGYNSCICHHGYTGESCDQDIDECQALPCQNGATCQNTIGNFTCNCAFGYNGPLCKNDTSSCRNVICENGGTCLDVGGGSYLCTCMPGFTGDKCQTTMPIECNSQTCKNNGTCLSAEFVGITCNCTKFWSGSYCQTDVNECAKDNTCKNGGFCENVPGSFSCDCPKGWNGNDCSVDVNECKLGTAQCVNGNCTNLPGSYKCVCDQDHTGPQCSVTLNYCKNQTCSQHGTCHELATGYRCECTSGYTGVDCEVDTNECADNVCGSNSLNCSNLPGSYNCTCKPGWQGVNCTVDVNECNAVKMIPCSGNGLCTNLIGSYKCNCFPGFSGKDCSSFVNNCKNIHCHNNGSCVVRNSETKCACASGWSGISCEDDVDECEVDYPCNNSGICENTDGSFYCRCLGGWTGNVCQSDVNECIKPPCQNKAICSNNPGSYQCACQNGWLGMNCEIKKIMTLQGSTFTFVFKQNISERFFQPTLTYTYKFLSQYVCGNVSVAFLKLSIGGNILKFKASCKDRQINKDMILSTLHTIPNNTLVHLFPSPLLQVIETSNGPVTKPSSNKSWISSHWPVVVGPLGALILVVVVIVISIFVYRKKSKGTSSDERYLNPSYDMEYRDLS